MGKNLTKLAAESQTAPPAGKKVAALSMGAMAIMIVTNIVSMRGMASQAEYGYGSIFYYVFAALVFLVPYALVCAELASTYTRSGGLFRWCAEAFGPKWGWVAMYLEWQMVVIWFPAVLMFAAVSLAFIFWPETFDVHLAKNVIYTLIVVLAVYWVATFVTFKGQKYANRLSTFGGLTGTIIPAIILMALGLIYWLCGHTIYIPTNQSFFPDFADFSDIVLAASIFLFYAGMEMQAVHVPSMVNPSKNFPKACFISVVAILCIFVFCTLAIGAAVPEKDINLLQSLLVAYNKLWASLGVPWLGNVMALLITVGALAQVTVVISAPSTGILAVGRAGFLPRGLQKVNKNGIQVPILWVQGIFVTVLALVLVVMPSVESAYQVLSQMSTVLYLIMVVIIYGAFLRLRRTEPNAKRGFKVPCGNAGKWVVFLLGVAGALLALVISFVPPAQITTGSPVTYVGIILIGVCVFVAFPFIVYAKRKSSWRDSDNDFYPFNWEIEGRRPDEVSKWEAGYQPTEAEIEKAMEEGIADDAPPRTKKDIGRLF
ncbi:MAG: amino acid permease [Muribaculaceae bacterium]|nr:amino acid permease [Muribaculaceae bacterium]